MRDWIIAWLVWLSADPVALDVEHPRAAAAVAAARASMAVDAPQPPGPAPEECGCGRTCVNGKWKPDGRIEQPCHCKCARCIKKPGCPDGKCVPKASPASASPAAH